VHPLRRAPRTPAGAPPALARSLPLDPGGDETVLVEPIDRAAIARLGDDEHALVLRVGGEPRLAIRTRFVPRMRELDEDRIRDRPRRAELSTCLAPGRPCRRSAKDRALRKSMRSDRDPSLEDRMRRHDRRAEDNDYRAHEWDHLHFQGCGEEGRRHGPAVSSVEHCHTDVAVTTPRSQMRRAERDRTAAPERQARIKTAHCRVGKISYKTSTKARMNRVLSERPRAGRRLAKGTKVNLTVGRGPR
jgi:hypothetical protein